MSPETHRSIEETELLLSQQEPSNGLEVTIPTLDRRRRIMACLAGPLVVISLLIGTSAESTVGSLTELGIHDAAIALDWGPQLDLQGDTATEAVNQVYQAFHLYDGYYIDNIGEASGFASTWHQYQLLNMIDMAGVLNPSPDNDQKLSQGLNAINTYWNNSPSGYPAGYDAGRNFGLTTPERYVDDNLWMAQLLMRQYRVTGDEAYADRAEKIMALFISQRDAETGGAYWKVQLPTESDHGRVMASNATAIPTLVELYLSGHGDASYVTVAEQTFNWIQRLYDPATGLYFDNISAYGQIEKTIYTYNQAEALKSMMALNKVDPVRYPLSKAIDFAATTLDYFSEHNTYGIAKFDTQYLSTAMYLASIINNPALTNKVEQGLALAKKAIPKSPDSLADAAASATILSLSEMPFSKWAELN